MITPWAITHYIDTAEAERELVAAGADIVDVIVAMDQIIFENEEEFLASGKKYYELSDDEYTALRLICVELAS